MIHFRNNYLFTTAAIENVVVLVECDTDRIERLNHPEREPSIVVFFTINIDGYETEATMTYCLSYPDEQNGSKWDAGQLHINGWDMLHKTHSWKVFAKASELVYMLNDVVLSHEVKELA